MKIIGITALFAASLLPSVFSGSIPGLYNTGVNDDGTLLDNEQTDTHYTLSQSGDPAVPGPDVFTLAPGFPVGPWLDEGPNSRWIAPQADQSLGNAPGNFTFATTFNLTGLDPATAQISGKATADNSILAVRLNGTDLGLSLPVSFNGWNSFTIPIGSPFIDGTNTLEFDVSNAGDTANPVGFRAEMTGRATSPNDPPVIATQPLSQTVIPGDIVTFNVDADGVAPLHYQWKLNNVALPNSDAASFTISGVSTNDAGQYSVTISNAIGQVSSSNVTLTVLLPYPGIYNTGLSDARQTLNDADQDPHYQLVVNANDPSATATFLEDSTVFPIVAGPWLANSAKSKWIAPMVETSTASTGDYSYQLLLDLTGYDPTTAFIAGSWASDDGGSIFLNGADTGFKSAGFGGYSEFNITNGFISGTNRLEFRISNGAIGYTGLRVENLRGTASNQTTVAQSPRVVIQPKGATKAMTDTITFTTVADGATPLSYQWLFNSTPITNATNASFAITRIMPSDQGAYSVRISNSFGSTNSAVAQLTVLQPQLGAYNTGVDTSGGLVAPGEPDPHYLLMSSGDAAYPGPAAYVPASAPIPPWVENTDGSEWIGPRPDAADAGVGTYHYRLLFNIAETDLATAALSAEVATDDGNLGIFFNGEDVGVGASAFTAYTDLIIPAGSPFVAGLNSLDFYVSNGGASANPTGLRVDQLVLSGVTPVAEPPTLAVTVSGSNLRIAWPASATGFILQETSALPGGWTASIASVTLDGNENVATPPLGTGAKFYRLVQ